MVVARVRSVQAPRRELRLDETPPFTWPDPAPEWVRLRMPGEATVARLKVAHTQRESGGVVLTLPPGVPRETVSALRGALLVVTEQEAATYRVEGWFARAWKGYRVVTVDGEYIGLITEVWEGTANAALTIESENGDAWVLPAIEQVVSSVDEDTETLTIFGLEPHGIRHED